MNEVLILTDGKAGHENQSKALARALGCGYALHELHFKSRLHKALSYVLDALGFLTPALFDRPPVCERGRYAAVIGTGSGTFYAVKTVARQLGVTCGVVLYPRGYRLSTFDCVLAPAFDRPVQRPNVIALPANLVANDLDFYARGEASFRARYTPSAREAVAVIIGGPNACSTMSVPWVRRVLDELFAENAGCEFWVTTSRRTPADVEKAVATYPWNYRLLYSQDHYNPIPAFVRLAKRLYVTAESTGMLSEACTFGNAEVKVLDNLKHGNHKFRRFVTDLRAGGYVDGARKVDLATHLARARQLMGL